MSLAELFLYLTLPVALFLVVRVGSQLLSLLLPPRQLPPRVYRLIQGVYLSTHLDATDRDRVISTILIRSEGLPPCQRLLVLEAALSVTLLYTRPLSPHESQHTCTPVGTP